MNVTFVIRHFSDPSTKPALEERLVDLSDSFSRYFVNLRSVHWTITEEGASHSVACQLGARSGLYQALSTAADPFAAANETYEKLVRQRRRVKKQRIGGRRHALARDSVATGDSEEAQSTPEPT